MINHKIYIDAYNLNNKPWVDKILAYLKENKYATVTDIGKLLKYSHSDASQRLKRLRAIGYIKDSQQGKGHYKTQCLTGKNFKDVMKEYAEYLLKITQ